ncbi:hypothetical protein QQZ08_006865 [Neonectria magnoliae]|uniref:Uncharacterized protein n=1 Tax=Neonectria magnoliae TaxID=2732573 RepID=A0ABR1HZU8_9HYPO
MRILSLANLVALASALPVALATSDQENASGSSARNADVSVIANRSPELNTIPDSESIIVARVIHDKNFDWPEESFAGEVKLGDRLFDNADELGFKIFFSFDMSGSYFSSPDQYAAYLDDHLSRESYFTYNDVPFVSTFGGESVSSDQWKNLRNAVGDILIVPSFYQSTPSSTFFDKYPELDGMFNWNSWPQIAEGKVIVSTDDDKTYQQAAKNSGKLFMMGLSPLQFKHFDPNNNWYRRGEQNREYRFGQVLEVQPDMLEI